MQGAFKVFIIAALLAVSAYAQGKHEAANYNPSPVHIAPPKGKSTPSIPISESDRKKQCPAGFQHIGKQCVQTLTAQAEIVCRPGSSLFDGKCAKFFGKSAECPAAYTEIDGGCARSSETEPEIICPQGYTLTGNDQCARRVQGPTRAVCPGGSVAKGDQCVRKATETPQLVCANGYTLEGTRCIREETFDCTPARKPSLRTYKDKPVATHHTGKKQLPPPTKEEYVVQSTCKKIVSEPARRICHNGVLEGKVCVIEVTVEPLIEPGRFHEEAVPASTQCPPGYAQGAKGACVNTEFAQPQWICPPNTIDLGDRCATFSPAKVVCPQGFALDDGTTCIKTVFAAPIVEYTVTYSCTGKNCGN